MASDEKGWQKRVKEVKDKVHKKSKSKQKDEGESGAKKKRKTRGKKKDTSEDDSDGDKDDDWGGFKKPRAHKRINSVVRCYDGFRMSVQASRDHFCTPRQDTGPYTHVEVAYPNRLEELILPYADGASTIAGLRPTIYVNVPAEVVLATIEAHAGMVAGQLPELATSERTSDSSDEADEAYAVPTSVVHLGAPPPPPPSTTSIHLDDVSDRDVSFDSNGSMWAAACEPPDDTPSALTIDTSNAFDNEDGAMMGSPLSPTMFMDMMTAFPTAFGPLSPPPALLYAAFSPIQPTNYLMIEDKKETDHS